MSKAVPLESWYNMRPFIPGVLREMEPQQRLNFDISPVPLYPRLNIVKESDANTCSVFVLRVLSM